MPYCNEAKRLGGAGLSLCRVLGGFGGGTLLFAPSMFGKELSFEVQFY